MNVERIDREIAVLGDGGQQARLAADGQGRHYVLYENVPTGGAAVGLPDMEDVLVPVPEGYPGAMIDLAGLRVTSPLLSRLRGGQNNQGQVQLEGQTWQFASYHPHNGGGGPAWDPIKYGFHTYFDHLASWLACIA